MEYEGDSDTKSNWYTWNNLQKLVKGDHPDFSIIKNSEKRHEDLRTLAVLQTPIKTIC